MGLDTSHDAWHGAYSGFSRWRKDIAVALGIVKKDQNLYPFYDYDTGTQQESPLDWGHWNAMTDAQGEWTQEPDDPVWYLLAHSDCDGVIKHEHLLALADRLEPLIPVLDDPESVSMWKATRTKNFVDGLRRAHEAGEDLDFH